MEELERSRALPCRSTQPEKTVVAPTIVDDHGSTAVVVSSVKAAHCRDRFERTRLKMGARKVLEARLWSAEKPGWGNNVRR